jgi:hypothetical protein
MTVPFQNVTRSRESLVMTVPFQNLTVQDNLSPVMTVPFQNVTRSRESLVMTVPFQNLTRSRPSLHLIH